MVEQAPLKRKLQLWRWLAKDDGEHRVLPNQIALIEMKGEAQCPQPSSANQSPC